MNKSSFIKDVNWQLGKLYVRMHAGFFYVYDNVPESVFEDFRDADSWGKFFAQNIKGVYEGTKYQEVTYSTNPVTF